MTRCRQTLPASQARSPPIGFSRLYLKSCFPGLCGSAGNQLNRPRLWHEETRQTTLNFTQVEVAPRPAPIFGCRLLGSGSPACSGTYLGPLEAISMRIPLATLNVAPSENRNSRRRGASSTRCGNGNLRCQWSQVSPCTLVHQVRSRLSLVSLALPPHWTVVQLAAVSAVAASVSCFGSVVSAGVSVFSFSLLSFKSLNFSTNS
jgi:hypothetical protein